MPYPVENIPDSAQLFRRLTPDIHYKSNVRRIEPAAFMLRRDKKGIPLEIGLSADWDQYSTAEKSAYDRNTGKKYYVAGLYAQGPRDHGLDVVHSPSRKNQAHSEIRGDSLTISKESNLKMAAILVELSISRVTSI